MTDTTEQDLIGPLTAAEWAQFRLQDADDQVLPPCCGEVSDLRDAIFDLLRMGGDEMYGAHLRSIWDIVDANGLGDHPLFQKLHAYYVAGRSAGPSDARMAEFLTADPGLAEGLLKAAPEAWDLKDPVAVRTALGRLTGKMYATPDKATRDGYMREIVRLTGFSDDQVRLVFDAFRGNVNLPIE